MIMISIDHYDDGACVRNHTAPTIKNLASVPVDFVGRSFSPPFCRSAPRCLRLSFRFLRPFSPHVDRHYIHVYCYSEGSFIPGSCMRRNACGALEVYNLSMRYGTSLWLFVIVLNCSQEYSNSVIRYFDMRIIIKSWCWRI